MKNVSATRRKNFIPLVLAVISLILSLVIPPVLSALFPDAFSANPTLITVLTMVLFWMIAVVLFTKNIKKTILTEALVANEKTIRGDRVSFPSADGSFDTDAIKSAFSKDGFTITDTEDGFTAQKDTKTLVCRFLITADTSAERHCVNIPDKKKTTCAVTVYLCDGITDEQKKSAKMTEGYMQYAEMAVYADRATGLAYYNGGSYARDSAETAAQNIILHNVLLRDALPEKTEQDKTKEETDLEQADIETLLYEMSHPGQEEIKTARTLQDGELRIDLTQRNGVILFRTGDAVISHPYEIDSDGYLRVPDINYAVTILPKMRSARKKEVIAFKEALEKNLSEKGISFKYE